MENGITHDPEKPALPEPGSPEDLGLERPAPDADAEAEKIEDEGEPFDGNFA